MLATRLMVKVREIINVEGLPVDGFDDGAAMDPSKLSTISRVRRTANH